MVKKQDEWTLQADARIAMHYDLCKTIKHICACVASSVLQGTLSNMNTADSLSAVIYNTKKKITKFSLYSDFCPIFNIKALQRGSLLLISP